MQRTNRHRFTVWQGLFVFTVGLAVAGSGFADRAAAAGGRVKPPSQGPLPRCARKPTHGLFPITTI